MSDSADTDRGSGRYRNRLVLGLLAASVPVLVLLVVVLTEQAGGVLRGQTQALLAQRAEAAATKVDNWVAERQTDLAFGSGALGPLVGRLDEPRQRRTAETILSSILRSVDAYDVVQLVDTTGRTLLTTDPELAMSPAGQDWFERAAAGTASVSPLLRERDELRWVVAEPVRDSAGAIAAVILGDLRVEALADLVGEPVGRDAEVVVANADRLLVFSTLMGAASDGATLLEEGSLSQEVDTAGARAALAGESGSGRYPDYRGVDVLAGWAPVRAMNWAVITKLSAAEALAPVRKERALGAGLGLLGILGLMLFANLFARRETEHLRALADETTAASGNVRSNAEQLSVASRQLAATTTQQSAAVTETSATMEELARAAASIADTVGRVASQTAETRENLEQAEADVQRSSERTLALVERVDRIGDILTLINDIADQTNLLALNAAIEAARAGDSGRGFSVVADEVRRLAERSKASATDIATLVESTQAETDATLAAMEKGAKQMLQGLLLLEEVADATAQVRLTTQQQRTAAEQVVETMEQTTESSREVSSTAREITAAASSLAELAVDLEESAKATRGRF